MKKRPFSLVEVLVASMLGLFMITALIQMLGFFKGADSKSAMLCEQGLHMIRIKEELGESLALADGAPIDHRRLPSESGLLFSFDNGIDINPHFCGALSARLWMNKDELCLSLYGKKEERHRSLLKGVESLAISAWNGTEWICSDLIEVSKNIQVIKMAFISQGKKEEIITHMVYSNPIEVVCSTTQPL